jgi:hypothetical protein
VQTCPARGHNDCPIDIAKTKAKMMLKARYATFRDTILSPGNERFVKICIVEREELPKENGEFLLFFPNSIVAMNQSSKR